MIISTHLFDEEIIAKEKNPAKITAICFFILGKAT